MKTAAALTIWLAPSGDLNIGIPPSPRGHRGHTVTVPANEHGIAALLKLLHDRQANPEATIGTPGCPTQYDLREVARQVSENETKRKREAAEALLQELGL